MQTNIISVKYEDNYIPKTFGGKAYSYYTAIDVKVGELVVAPSVYGDRIARVSEVNIPTQRVECFKSSLKLITDRINKEEYLKSGEILKEVA